MHLVAVVSRAWGDRLSRSSPPLAPPSRSVVEQVPRLEKELFRWLRTPAAQPDEPLRAAFRELTRRMRADGIPTSRAIRSLAALEDTLVDLMERGDATPEGDAAPARDATPGAGDRIRLALRGMLLDTVRASTALDARLSRERADALEFYGEVLVHEIGNRIGAAQTAVELLRTPDLEIAADRQDDLLRLIAEGVEQALKSVEDVTALMVAQARLQGEHLPVRQVMEQVVRTLNPIGRRHGVRLETELDGAGQVPVDGARMRLILTNLVMNGIRYRHPERDGPFVRVRAATGARELRVEVEDNGRGIPEKEQEEIFLYRERGSACDQEAVRGSGLGLAVVAEAVGQMGATLELESRVMEGSTFRLRIPVDSQATD